MKTKTIIFLATSLSAYLFAGPASAQQMNYQGLLLDDTGKPLDDGQQTVEFNIYTAPTGNTTRVWGPFRLDGDLAAGVGHVAKADLSGGRFNAILGPVDTGSRSLIEIFSGGGDRYLGITVGTNAEITPRQQILAAPEAIHAQRADHATTATALGNPTGVSTINILNGKVGIGTADPAATLQVDSVTPNEPFRVRVDGAVKLSANRNGGLAVGGATTPPVDGLSVIGEANIQNFLGVTQLKDADAFGITGLGGTTRRWRFLTTSSETLLLREASFGRLAALARNGDSFWGSLDSDAGGNATLTVKGDQGNVGIGTTNPTQAKLVVEGGGPINAVSDGGNFYHSFFQFNGFQSLPPGTEKPSLSIKTSHGILGGSFTAISDARIKNIDRRSDASTDLATINQLEITDYHYKDQADKGTRPQKKVIAQQVRKVFPQAVSFTTDCIPDIYQAATTEDGWVTLATDLTVGERVRIFGATEKGIYEVLEVREGAFRTEFKPKGSEVFVFGREVDDFHIVDYDAIAMLNVSATQELSRKADARDVEISALRAANAKLQAENTALTTKLTTLEARDQAFERRLSALERGAGTDVPVRATQVSFRK